MAGSPQHATLTGNVVTTMTFDKSFAEIDVCSRDGVAEVWFTVDGTTPVIGAIGSFVLPAAINSMRLTPRDDGVDHTGPTVVKLLSASAVKVSVSGL